VSFILELLVLVAWYRSDTEQVLISIVVICRRNDMVLDVTLSEGSDFSLSFPLVLTVRVEGMSCSWCPRPSSGSSLWKDILLMFLLLLKKKQKSQVTLILVSVFVAWHGSNGRKTSSPNKKPN